MSSGLAFAIPGRWTGGKREEDEMRRLMAQEAAEAKARGELIEETSASDWSSEADEDDNEEDGEDFEADSRNPRPVVEENAAGQSEVVEAEEKLVDQLRVNKKPRGLRDDTGHDADMDDTSMSSRASSRMLESINVMSMDSMNVMYDSEYDDLRLASASAGGPIMSDFESDLPDIDLNNVLDDLDNANNKPSEVQLPKDAAVLDAECSEQNLQVFVEQPEEEQIISTIEEPLEPNSKTSNSENKVENSADD